MANESIKGLVDELVALSQQPPNVEKDDQRNKTILSKATELIQSVQSPFDRGIALLAAVVEPAVVRTLMTFHVLEAIPAPPQSITLRELAQATGVQESLLARLLRIVTSTGFIKHGPQKTSSTELSYTHSPISQTYSEGPLGTIFSAVYDELVTTTMLPEYFQTHGPCEPDGPDAATRNPQTWRHGCEGEMTAFQLLEKNPEKLKRAHALFGMVASIRPWTGFYDYTKLLQDAGDRPVFVDVGGGNGTLIGKILEAHPEISPEQCVLQDREAVIDLAKQRQQDGELPNGVQCQVHDFFTPQPVQGAKAYHFRAIAHDWSDSVVVDILANVVPAMAPDSKVLIAECVTPEVGVEGLAGMMDMCMLNIGGKERTRKDFEDVLGRAGLKIQDVYPAGKDGQYSGFSVVEAVLK